MGCAPNLSLASDEKPIIDNNHTSIIFWEEKIKPIISSADGESLENVMIRVEGKDVTFGKPDDFPSYGWDNEYGEVKRL